MQTDGSSAPSDDFRLRLAWDGDDEGDEKPGAGRSPRKPAERAAAPQGRSADDLSSVEVLECSLREAIDELTAGRHEMSALREELRVASAEGPARRRGKAAQGEGVTGELAEEVAALRAEVVALRRRISLRADGPPELANDSAAHLADLIAERLRRGS